MTVVDGNPIIHAPASVVAEATDSTGALVFYDVTADDAVDGPVAVECLPASPSWFPVEGGGPGWTGGAGPGTPGGGGGLLGTDVICRARRSSWTHEDSRFQRDGDRPATPPTVTVPAPITVDAGPGGTAAVSFTASAHDLVSGALPAACTPASGSAFLVGTATVDCMATDALGNVGRATFTITVRPQANTPPVVTVPANLVVEATGPTGATVSFSASATDAQDGGLPAICVPASGALFPIGTTTVTCKATDAAGAVGSASFKVTVKDTQVPRVEQRAGDHRRLRDVHGGREGDYTKPTATDAVDGARPVACTPASGAQFAVNKTTVTCSASDTRGNSTSATFTVWVQYQAPSDGTFFLAPIRPDGSSIFRVGRPVPARFRLTGASKSITNLVAKFQATKISDAVQGTTEVTSDETIDDTDMVFKYRSLLKFYAYRWKTRDQSHGTYQLRADLGDGVTHQSRCRSRQRVEHESLKLFALAPRKQRKRGEGQGEGHGSRARLLIVAMNYVAGPSPLALPASRGEGEQLRSFAAKPHQRSI